MSPTHAGEALERRVGGDLQRLGGAGVLGVLEDLLLAAGAAQQVDRRLADRERLADDGLGETEDRAERAAAAAERLAPATDALGMVARLAQMGLERAAVGAARRHRDLRGEDAHERALVGVRLVEVLKDLRLGCIHRFVLLSSAGRRWKGRKGAVPPARRPAARDGSG